MDEVQPGKIDTLNIQTVLEELIKIARPITRRVSYGYYEYPVINTEPFYKGLRELGVNGYAIADFRQSGIGVDCVSLESARYLIECFSERQDEEGYHNIKQFITSVRIKEKTNLKEFKDMKPEGKIVKLP